MSGQQQDSGDPGAQNQDQGLSNSDWKAHPLTKKVTQELAEERKATKAMKERLDALEAAENERQTKTAERKEDYEKAMEKRLEKARKEEREKWDAEQSVKDKRAEAKLQLVKAGFKNERFLRGALEDFDPAKQTAEEFAKAMSEDETNKQFLESQKTPPKNPDPHPAAKNGKTLMTPAEIQALRATGKPEDAKIADAAADALWIANNGHTGLPT